MTFKVVKLTDLKLYGIHPKQYINYFVILGHPINLFLPADVCPSVSSGCKNSLILWQKQFDAICETDVAEFYFKFINGKSQMQKFAAIGYSPFVIEVKNSELEKFKTACKNAEIELCKSESELEESQILLFLNNLISFVDSNFEPEYVFNFDLVDGCVFGKYINSKMNINTNWYYNNDLVINYVKDHEKIDLKKYVGSLHPLRDFKYITYPENLKRVMQLLDQHSDILNEHAYITAANWLKSANKVKTELLEQTL